MIYRLVVLQKIYLNLHEYINYTITIQTDINSVEFLTFCDKNNYGHWRPNKSIQLEN